MALSTASQKALLLRTLAKELDPETVRKGMPIQCDNKGSIDLAKNSACHPRTKHIVCHYFVRESVEDGKTVLEIEIVYRRNGFARLVKKTTFDLWGSVRNHVINTLSYFAALDTSY